jgi:hypothetical protein
MIHLIGTCHKTQIQSDLSRKGALGIVPWSKVTAFRKYLSDAVETLTAVGIAEELSEEVLEKCGHGADSVARSVAQERKLVHMFCEPSPKDREKLGLRVGSEMVEHAQALATKTSRAWEEVHREEVRKQFTVREKFWIEQLFAFGEETSVIFICGADHIETFSQTLSSSGLLGRVHCPDWTELAEIPCPCCL